MGASVRPIPVPDEAEFQQWKAQQGNVDLTNRPRVKNPDGSVSTVRSMSFNEGGKEILVPTVSDDGRILSNDEAIDLYHQTGKHLGKFDSIASADSAANAIHNQQANTLTHDDAEFQAWKAKQGLPSWRVSSSSWGDGKPTPKRVGLPAPDFDATLAGVGTHAKNALQGIPGAETAMAAGDAAYNTATGSPTSYSDAYDQLEKEKAAIPAPLRIGEQMLVGGKALGALLPSASTVTIGGRVLNPTTLWQAVKAGAKTGAGFGAADAALSAKPQSLADRATSVGIGTAAGGAAGGLLAGGARAIDKAQELRTLANRVGAAPTRGSTALQTDDAIKAASAKSYGKVATEGTAAANEGRISPDLTRLLDEHPDIKPYADAVRGPNVDDAKATQDVIALMNERVGDIKRVLKRTPTRELRIELRQLGAAKQALKEAATSASQRPPITLDVAPEVFETQPRITPGREPMAGPVAKTPLSGYTTAPSDPTMRQALRDFPQPAIPPTVQGPGGPQFQLGAQPGAVRPGVRIETPGMRVQTAPAEQLPPTMPSLPAAIAERARMERAREVAGKAGDAAKRIMQGTPVRDAKLLSESPEAFSRDIQGMDPAQARAALVKVLGAAKERGGVELTPHSTLFGTLAQGLTRRGPSLNRISPYVRQLDQKAGNAVRPEFQTEDVLRLLGIVNAPMANP